jgi:hypothetical protein
MKKFENPEISFAAAHSQFETCWNNPSATRFELPAVDVKEVLSLHYVMNPQIDLTREMIWDMECKKAFDPSTYVPYVVSQAGIWGRRTLSDGCDHFLRWSTQKAWLSEQRGQVIESVFINHSSQKIVFLGVGAATSEDGGTIIAADYQPLVHVEHSAGGPEHKPHNLWRIVILTESEDDRYTRPFKDMMATGLLPGYLEIYIERDLNIELMRR